MNALRYVAAVGCLGIAGPALAQAPGAVPNAGGTLTDEDRQMLRVVYAYVKSECARDSSAAYCSSLLPEKSPPAATASVATVAPLAAEPHPLAGSGVSPPPALVAADATRHLTGDTGVTMPEKNTADVSFATATDTKNASATLSLDLAPVFGGFNALAITVQTPLGQGSDYQNLATLDGLTKASTLGLQYTVIPTPRYISRALVYNDDEYQIPCNDVLSQAEAIDSKIASDELVKQTGKWCNDDFLEQAINKSKVISASQKTILTDKLHALHATTIPVLQSMWMFAINGKLGYEKHDFYSASTLAKSTVERYPWQVGAAATYVFDKGLMSFTLGYNFQKSYKDGRINGQQEVLCPPPTTGNVECVNGYIDAPKEQDKHLFSADWRFIAPPGSFFIPIGVDPGITYDAKSHAFGFQLPIYLSINSAKGLTGGFRYDYTSEKKKSTVGIFVAAALCVLPGYSGCTPPASKAGK